MLMVEASIARLCLRQQAASEQGFCLAAPPGGPSAGGSSSILWDEQLMAGILDLNRLQRSLAITTLTWAATLQEPALFTQMLAATSSAGPAAVTAAAAATASAVAVPGSPLGNAAAAAAIAAVSELSETGSGSTHGSMFHMPAALAAQRMGISDGAGALVSFSQLFCCCCAGKKQQRLHRASPLIILLADSLLPLVTVSRYLDC